MPFSVENSMKQQDANLNPSQRIFASVEVCLLPCGENSSRALQRTEKYREGDVQQQIEKKKEK